MDDNILMLQSMLLTVLQNCKWNHRVISQLFNIIITPVITFYILKDIDYFKNQFILLLPKSKRMKYIVLMRDIDNVFGKFIRGQIIIAVLSVYLLPLPW